jgi:hypothetical protein
MKANILTVLFGFMSDDDDSDDMISDFEFSEFEKFRKLSETGRSTG